MTYSLTSNKGKFYRGNLHTHTTRSDGIMPIEDCVAYYKSLGYDFLAITDHRRYYAGGDIGGMLLLDGLENDISYDIGYHKCHHFVGIGSGTADPYIHEETHTSPSQIKEGTQAQGLIDEMRRKCELIIHAHPLWSNTEWEDYGSLAGCDMVEVYNTGCDVLDSNGIATSAWQIMLSKGMKIYACATDDGHRDCDVGGGWVEVCSPSLTQTNIIAAIKRGQFYATTGPQLREMTFEDGVLSVECSPVKRINFITSTNQLRNKAIYANDHAGMLTKGSYRIDFGTAFVRVELTDFAGKVAWSQPIFF